MHADVARVLGLSARQVRDILSEWVKQDWLEISAEARKIRRYRLSAEYRRANKRIYKNSPIVVYSCVCLIIGCNMSRMKADGLGFALAQSDAKRTPCEL